MTPEEKGFRRTLRLQGRDLKVISAGASSGQTFRATVNRIGRFELTTEIGGDPRGKRIIEIAATGAPAFNSGDIVQETQNQKKHKLCDVGLDSPDYSLKYVLEEGVPGKDDWA